MLQSIRDRAQSWLMWVIVALISVPFALWGIHQYFGPAADVPVATINKQELSLRDFQEAYQQQRLRLQSTLGGGALDLDEAAESRLRQLTLERMIDEEVLVQGALRHGLHIGDVQLAEIIRSLDVFQVNGVFAQEQYERWLRIQGYAPGGFEHTFRRSLLGQQLQFGVVESSFILPDELNRILALATQARSFAYIHVPAKNFSSTITLAEGAVDQYYEQNQSLFSLPEQVNVEYLELNRELVAQQIEVNAEDLQRRYEEQSYRFGEPEQRRARHLLLEIPEGADEEEVAGVLARAEDLRSRLLAGADFEALAREHSQDPGSAQTGGDLGFFARGMMVGPFEDAVFALNVGDTSEAVRTEFGVHVIRLEEIRPGATKPFEAVRDELLREMQFERAEHLFYEQAERLANLAFEQPDSLAPAADNLGLEIKESGFFDRNGGSGVAGEARFVAAAFSDDVRVHGHNSEPLELSGGKVVVLRQKDYRPAAQRSLSEVRSQIEDQLVRAAAQQEAVQAAETYVQRLARGDGREDIAAALGASWIERSELRRDAADVAPEILKAAFAMAESRGDGAAEYRSIQLSSGDSVLIALTAVHPTDPLSLSESERRRWRDRLRQADGEAAYDAFLKDLRAAAKVRTFPDRI